MVGQYIQDSKIINNTFDTDYVNLTTSFSLDKIGKSSIGKYFTILKIQARIVKALLSSEYDLCYMTLTAKGAGFYKDLAVVAVLKLFRKNIIYHFHNKGVEDSSKNKINAFLYRFAFQNTQSILLSPHLYHDIADYVKKEDVYFCANGIPETKEIFTISETIITDEQQPCKLLFLSNMMVEKGVLVLLKTCQLLKERNLHFGCHFIGSWSEITESRFSEIIQDYSLQNYVFAHGKKYNEEKLAFFHQSSVFVLPTYNECFPLVLLEAMEHSLPVVSTPEGGIPDIVVDGKTGFLIPQQNAEALADKLELLIKQPELRACMGVSGRKRYEELFTLKKFENNMKGILKKAIAHKRV
ncbi:glycosyltransferase [Pontibacter sp. 172403-2]|nr:glycosyltransferase [Pontibacter sp. 172403-2]